MTPAPERTDSSTAASPTCLPTQPVVGGEPTAICRKWVPEAIRFDHDPTTDVEVVQLTSEPVTSTNIYCEQRFTSADGKRIAIHRKPFGRPAELWVCDLRTMRLCRADEGDWLGANHRRNAVYYISTRQGQRCLMCLDLAELTTRELLRFDSGEVPGNGAVSPDERWFVGGPFLVRENVYSLRRFDLSSGRVEPLCEIEDMFNPHLQFDPANPRSVAVQINRGGRSGLVDGKRVLTSGLGATICLVDIQSGQVQALPVGRPHTPAISGHECWVGETGSLLFTAGQYAVSPCAHVTLRDPPENENHWPLAAIYAVKAGDTAPRVVATGLLFNHIAASDDGRFFIADDHPLGRIYIGSIVAGHYLPLCESHTRQGLCQHSHVHAYMTPDNQHVIFNSIVTGSAQVFAARLPDGFLDQLQKMN